MLRSTASKVMWVGRATVFLVGLAVILALVFGVATTAFGANGNPFLLGKSNVATAITKLAGTAGVDGPMLQLINNNAGANDTALALNVQAGEAPMRVNSNARVANLNAATAGRADSAASADTATNAQNANNLDNKDSSEFADGVGGVATNADKLDGLDSAQVRPVGRSSSFLSCTADSGPANCASTSITLPANARVLLNSTGSYYSYGDFPADGYYKGTCNFTRDGVDILSTEQIVGERQVATGAAPVHKFAATPGSQANTHVTEVLTAGTYAFGVRCTQNMGDVDWSHVRISAVTLGE